MCIGALIAGAERQRHAVTWVGRLGEGRLFSTFPLVRERETYAENLLEIHELTY
jgi:hypothetical protein